MPPGRLKHHLQVRRKTVAAAILLAGIAAGLVLYVVAPPPEEDLLANQANESKRYLRQMEEYGGTINVLASQLSDWFAGLWQGKTLGITIACLSGVLALVVFIALTPIAPPDDVRGSARPRDG